MKAKITSIVILIAMSVSGMAQDFEQRTTVRKNEKGIIKSVEFSKENKTINTPKSEKEFFRDVLSTQALDRFDKKSSKSRTEGFVHEHFEQYYNGLRVEGAGYVFHYRNGEMYFAHGNYIKIENLNTKPTITADEAKQSFTRYMEIPLESVSDYWSDLIIKEIPFNDDVLPMLVYKITLFADHANNTDFGFVDAQSGRVVLTERTVDGFSAPNARFETRYSGVQTATTYYRNGTYHLEDLTPGRAEIRVWDANNKKMRGVDNLNLASCRTALTDIDNDWKQTEHRPNNKDMGLDVFWALQKIRDRLFDVHGINSFDDEGHLIEAFIRHGAGTEADNAYWLVNHKVMVFGAGHSICHPLVSVDIVAHEFGHGITRSKIGNWTGDTNQRFREGMSDIWGAIMKYRITPNQPTWQIGNQIMRNHNCLRNLQNPNNNNAHTKIANTYNTSQYNNGNEYVKSGVFSHWFYLLVNGGSGTNGLGNSYTVHGVGMDFAEELIVKAVFEEDLLYTSSYDDLRYNFVQAAMALENNLYGIFAQQVENAWYAVGVGARPSQISFSGPSNLCGTNTGTYQIENLPHGASVIWNSNNPNIPIHPTTGVVNHNLSTSGISQSGTITASVQLQGAPNPIELAKTIVVGTVPNVSLISTLFNGAQVTYGGDCYFTDVITYNGVTLTWDNPYEITSGAWNDLHLTSAGETPGTQLVSGTHFKLNMPYWYCPSGLQAGAKVALQNACGWSDYKTIAYNCGLPCSGGGNGDDQDCCADCICLSYSPNPTSDELSVDFKNLPNDATYSVSLIDNTGKVHRSNQFKHQRKNGKAKSVKFNTSSLKEGTYYLHVDGGGKIEKIQIIIKRK